MKRIKGGLVTVLLALLIAGGGMAFSFFSLERVEQQALRTETTDNQEEIILTEEETDRLVILLNALEEDNLIRIKDGNGANIPEEKAWTMMATALMEMNYLMLGDYWFPDVYDIERKGYACELYADKDNRSVEVYRITICLWSGEEFSIDVSGILDARSGLLLSLQLSFTEAPNQEEYAAESAAESGTAADLGKYKEDYNGDTQIDAETFKEEYPLDYLVACVLEYYGRNTNFNFYANTDFDFYASYKYDETADCFRLEDEAGEYYVEVARDDVGFHFQLHKFEL